MIEELIGYADRISVAPGETVALKVSTDFTNYDAAIVRLIHGDANGPGFKEEVVAAEHNHKGRKQQTYSGSYGLVTDAPALSPVGGLTLQAWIYPTTPDRRSQGILSKWSGNSGYALMIGENGEAEFRLGDGTTTCSVRSGTRFRPKEWFFVAATFDPVSGRAAIHQVPLAHYPGDKPVVAEAIFAARPLPPNTSPLAIAALAIEPRGSQPAKPSGLYNGKIGQPAIFSRPLSDAELDKLRYGTAPAGIAGVAAAWDFAREIASPVLVDAGPNSLNGVAVNMPMRAVTSHNWTGDEIDFKHAVDQYGAIHFHDDDLADAGWETDFTWTVPQNSRTGFYAARLRNGEHEDHVPFFVRPPRGSGRRPPIALLAPTFTYLAYANETHVAMARHQAVHKKRELVKDPLDHYRDEHPEIGVSLYDSHTDDSGACYSSYLRPIPAMRPKYRSWMFGSPRHLAADLYILDWLEQKGFDYDVFTDHDLDGDGDGRALLDNYRVVLTGSHPEYWSSRARDAMLAYVEGGGRQIYLGGNGYYWVTSRDLAQPQMIEVRKGIAGTRAWNSAPGELYHSSTGELGGLWRHRGKAPNQMVGVGFKAMGYDAPTPPYRREKGSFDPRAAFIFDGIGADEPIGNFGLVLGGAAGDELDCIDFDLGTPPQTLLLASASGHSPYYVPVVEDHNEMSDIVIAEQRSLVRADMVYLETAGGGAVFSTGSISWSGSLSHNGYDNNVSRITENVLRHFSGS